MEFTFENACWKNNKTFLCNLSFQKTNNLSVYISRILTTAHVYDSTLDLFTLTISRPSQTLYRHWHNSSQSPCQSRSEISRIPAMLHSFLLSDRVWRPGGYGIYTTPLRGFRPSKIKHPAGEYLHVVLWVFMSMLYFIRQRRYWPLFDSLNINFIWRITAFSWLGGTPWALFYTWSGLFLSHLQYFDILASCQWGPNSDCQTYNLIVWWS